VQPVRRGEEDFTGSKTARLACRITAPEENRGLGDGKVVDVGADPA
jgi:hypothetical protein